MKNFEFEKKVVHSYSTTQSIVQQLIKLAVREQKSISVLINEALKKTYKIK